MIIKCSRCGREHKASFSFSGRWFELKQAMKDFQNKVDEDCGCLKEEE